MRCRIMLGVAAANELDSTPVLISVGGLPATGKSTVAQLLAAELPAAYVRIDSIETAIGRSEGQHVETNSWELPPGYEVGYDVVADQLRLGLDVVADSVNPLRASRDAWRDAGLKVGAHVIEVEIVCSDVDEHCRRAEERVVDVVGLVKPTWEEITNREYDSWDRDRIVIDTAILSVRESVQRIRAATGRRSSTRGNRRQC